MKKFRLSLAVLLGGAGGAINAFLVFAGVPVNLENKYLNFQWHLVPAGFAHGALLALIAVLLAGLFVGQKKPLQLIGFLFAGYIAGWLSGIPLSTSLSNKMPDFSVIWWPLDNNSGMEALTGPFLHFGLVSGIYFLALTMLKIAESKNLLLHLLAAAAAGTLGSLYWWYDLDVPKLSLLHGSIWGALTGFGFWKQNAKGGKS